MSTTLRQSLTALVIFLSACTPSKRHGWPVYAGPRDATGPHASAPTAGAEPDFVAPIPTEILLPNGLRVLVVPQRDLPLVHVRLLLRGGSAIDPPTLPGLAAFYAEMLRTGTETLGSEALADAFESLGTRLAVDADYESVEMAATVLTTHAARLTELMADVVLHPAFASGELERVRRQLTVGLQQERDEPRALAERLFWHVAYGAHPYGHAVSGSSSALARVTREDVVAYGDRVARAKNATLVLVGDLDETQAAELAHRVFGNWAAGARIDDVAAPIATAPGVYVIDQPEAAQSQLRVGSLGVARSDPDRDALLLCNAVLGGQFNSRINMNLREDKGYTYGAFSHFAFMRQPGPFVVSTGVRTDTSAAALDEILREIAAMREAAVTQQELNDARNLYVLSLPSAFQTVGGVASSVAQLALYDLPLDHLRTLPQRLAAITPDDILRVARQHLHLDAMSIVVVGDRKLIEKSLEELRRGPPQPMTPEQIGL